MKFLAPLVLLAFVTGCAKYEYDIIHPPEFATHIGTKSDAVTNRDPLEYRWRTVDSRLVVRIVNPTSDPIQLRGDASTAVAPSGQSHPIPGQAIAPNSHVRLILPPRPPTVRRSGTTIGVGVGVRVDRRELGFPDQPFNDEEPTEPRYLSVQQGSDGAIFWEWEGETDVRLAFVYQRGEESFRHEFLIRRRRA